MVCAASRKARVPGESSRRKRKEQTDTTTMSAKVAAER
jgi:hypothetical protein